jgi:hypothetical protein
MKEVAEQEQQRYRHLVRQAPRLGMLITLVVLAVTACGGEKRQESTGRPLPEERQALHPGEYRSEEFKPSLSFRVGKGWSNVPPEVYDDLLITRGQDMGDLGFANLQGARFYKPTKTGMLYMVDVPEDMVGWFQRHPYLQISKPERVKVGGVKGLQFDVVVEDLPEDYSGICGSDCVDILRLSSGRPIAIWEQAKVGLISLEDVKGQRVTIGFGSPATGFDEHAPEALKVIDTVKWKSS